MNANPAKRSAVSFALATGVVALGHLIPLPRTVVDASWYGRSAEPTAIWGLHNAPITHLDGIVPALGPDLIFVIALSVVFLVWGWRRLADNDR